MDNSKPSEQMQSGNTSIVLDERDQAILRLLQRDAKLTVREIATHINLSSAPTHDRIKRLEQLKVIKGYVAIVDHHKVNKPITVICQVSLKNHDKETGETFIEAVKDLKEVVSCYNISGEFDFMLRIVTENMERYHHFFVNKLSAIHGIGQTKSIFVMDIIKDTHEII